MQPRSRAILCVAGLMLAAASGAAPGSPRYEPLPVAGYTLLIDWQGDYSDAQKVRLRRWLTEVGEAMTLLTGTLPRDPMRVVLSARQGDGPVLFGRTLRSEPQGIRFFIDPRQSLDAFVHDWTAYHEFSHLFLPFPGRADIWFAEGFASYYQNVIQYRAGLLSESEAWHKLVSGFERGRNDTADSDLTLGELSTQLRERRAYMRVYWSGALYFLEADARLRERSAGRMTLDDVVRAFDGCCLGRGRQNGRAIAAEFDRIAATTLFVPLFDDFAATTAMPDYAPALAAAGVIYDAGELQLAEPGFLAAAAAPTGQVRQKVLPEPRQSVTYGWMKPNE